MQTLSSASFAQTHSIHTSLLLRHSYKTSEQQCISCGDLPALSWQRPVRKWRRSARRWESRPKGWYCCSQPRRGRTYPGIQLTTFARCCGCLWCRAALSQPLHLHINVTFQSAFDSASVQVSIFFFSSLTFWLPEVKINSQWKTQCTNILITRARVTLPVSFLILLRHFWGVVLSMKMVKTVEFFRTNSFLTLKFTDP